jgi:hypothetical protein
MEVHRAILTPLQTLRKNHKKDLQHGRYRHAHWAPEIGKPLTSGLWWTWDGDTLLWKQVSGRNKSTFFTMHL